MTLPSWLQIFLILFGSGGVVVAALTWIRFRKTDAAGNDKLKAEAQEIRAKSDVLITDGALRIVERLSKDLDEARDEIEKLIVIVADLKILHEKHKAEYKNEAEELHNKLKEARDLIAVKRRHCAEIKRRITQLQELLKLKQTSGQSGLTHEQLQEFIRKIAEIITYNNEDDETALLRDNLISKIQTP